MADTSQNYEYTYKTTWEFIFSHQYKPKHIFQREIHLGTYPALSFPKDVRGIPLLIICETQLYLSRLSKRSAGLSPNLTCWQASPQTEELNRFCTFLMLRKIPGACSIRGGSLSGRTDKYSSGSAGARVGADSDQEWVKAGEHRASLHLG